MTEPLTLEPGTTVVPGYEVLDHLHRSRAFDVYDAWSEERRARCVLKTLRPDRAGDRTARRRLELEGRLLRRLSHPHIVRGYEVLPGLLPVVVTETLRGQTLSHLIEASGPLSPAEAAVLGLQLLSAVGYLHGRGFLHLDLKPSNIVADGGRAIVIDLSIARRPGRVPAGLGTWCYLAPEQARGGSASEAADLWGVGAVLFEALTGDPPFDDGRDTADLSLNGSEAMVYPQLRSRATRLSRRHGIPRSLGALVDLCLDPDPAQRPALDEATAGLERIRGARSPRRTG